MKKPDPWCDSIRSRHGNVVSGGAARNIRIAAMGGMSEIVKQVTRNTLALANATVLKSHKSNRSPIPVDNG